MSLGTPEALRHLRRDAVLKRVIRQVGPCTLKPAQRQPYEALVRAIAHQQVHGRAAEAILGRFMALCPEPGFPAPEAVLALAPEAMRGAGLSANKVLAIRDIAEKAALGIIPNRAAARRLSDEALIERLVALRGVGRWTVEMLLIFTLGLPRCSGPAGTAKAKSAGCDWRGLGTVSHYRRLVSVARGRFGEGRWVQGAGGNLRAFSSQVTSLGGSENEIRQ